MDNLCCATCPFSEKLSTGATDNTACHLGRFADEPRHPSTWWCSEHPLAPGQRDRLAAMAIPGLVTCVDSVDSYTGIRNLWAPNQVARRAYAIADAMLAERAKKPKES
jgi:hypothetical protein